MKGSLAAEAELCRDLAITRACQTERAFLLRLAEEFERLSDAAWPTEPR
jgi:hypothetical protein